MSWSKVIRLRSGFFGTWCRNPESVQKLFVRRYAIEPPPHIPTKPLTKISLWGYTLLTVPVVTFSLGTWHVQKRKYKADLTKSLQERLNLPVVDLPKDINALNDMDYRRVRVRGKFLHDKEIYIASVNLIENGGYKDGGTTKKKLGSLVITPFKLTDRNLTILINRGWVPEEKILPEHRAEGQVEDEITIEGVVRHTESTSMFMPKNDPRSNVWFYRDIKRMAKKLGTSPVFLDATRESTVKGGPLGGQTLAVLRNKHLPYTMLLYAVSGLSGVLWYKKFIARVPLI